MNTRRKMRTMVATAVVLLMGATLVLAGMHSSRASATAGGVETLRYDSTKAFAVQRAPSLPSCTNATTYAPFTVTTAYGGNPFSEATRAGVVLGSNYLKIVPSTDPAYPWGIAMYNPSDQELRWNGSAWVTAPGGGFTTETRFTEKGRIYGADATGFLHNSFSGLGTFLSTAAFTSPRTYTPDPALNNCIDNFAVVAETPFPTTTVPADPSGPRFTG